MNTVIEYGIRILSPSERMKIYEQRRGDDEAQLERMARGIQTKRRILETLRMVPKHRALVVVN
jgi:hypothetical protein